MESGGGSNNQDGREDRTPPDEQQTKIEGTRAGQSLDPTEDARSVAGIGSSGVPIGGGAPGDSPFAPGTRPSIPGFTATDAIDLGPRFRPWSEPGPSGTGPMQCHFLRSVGADGQLADAQKTAVPTHRCAAFGDPLPLSLRQQELVCLQRVHVSCPRYVRGTLLANENEPGAASEGRQSRGIPILTVAGVVLVILALGILVYALVGWSPFGGGVPTAGPPVAAASASASPTRPASRAQTAAPLATASATPAAGTITLRTRRRARAATIGSSPGTGRSSPPSDSSPRTAHRPAAVTCSEPTMIPSAIARSSEAPPLRRSAGAKFTVIRRGGYS